MAGEEEQGRKKNFSMEEMNVVRVMFAENKEFLTSAFTNKITNAAKNAKWKEIATAVNALGVESRTASECKAKWKNMKSDAKKTFHGYKKSQKLTGGGCAPKTPSDSVMKTIDMMKDTTSFKGIDGGTDTFNPPKNPFLALSEMASNSDDNESDDENGHLPSQEVPSPSSFLLPANSPDDYDLDSVPAHSNAVLRETSRKRLLVTPTGTAEEKPPKRKHYEDARDVQLKVLRKEENVQDLKIENLKLQNTKLGLEIENAKLQKSKIQLEIDLLQKQVLEFVSKNNPGDILEVLCRSLPPLVPDDDTTNC